MHEFIAKHQDKIIGTLSGFDRLVFRGTLRSIVHDVGLQHCLRANHVLLKEFAAHADQVTRRLKEASLAQAEALGRPVQYLPSPQARKEAIARGIAARDGVRAGLVCVRGCVEPCWSFEIHRNPATKHLELVPRRRQCLFLDPSWILPRFGFRHARIQTWFPFPASKVLPPRCPGPPKRPAAARAG